MRPYVALGAFFAVIAALVFGSAGTFAYWQGWLFLAVYCAASVLISTYLLEKDPALAERRMRGGPAAETRPAERIIMTIVTLAFIGVVVVPGVDARFGWSHVPLAGVIVGNVFVATFFYVAYLVFRVNSFSAATIAIAKDQQVITTGPYAFVRHPMYAGAALLFIGIPLALGSYWGVLPFVIALPVLIWRIFDEEAMLKTELPAYRDYCAKVRWRLIPGVW